MFSAFDQRTGQSVALKLISAKVLDMAGGEHRFRREVDVLSRIRHPNVVAVLDAGADGRTFFIAFELLEGTSVEQALSLGPMDPRRVAAIAAQVLDALEVAHAAGVIHRDIKPANLHLVGPPPPAPEVVKLLDFGIAKSTEDQSQRLTKTGMMLGTPAYMAPEQVFGKPVGPATDLFALGIVMAEMLSGRPLYPEDTSPVLIVQDRVSRGRVPLPPQVEAGPLGPIVQRAVAIDPSQRFASASEMRAALIAHASRIGSAPFPAAPTPWPAGSVVRTEPSAGQVQRPPPPSAVRRERGMLGVVILLVVLAVAGIGLGVYFALHADDPRSTKTGKKGSKKQQPEAVATPPPPSPSAAPADPATPPPKDPALVLACPAVASLSQDALKNAIVAAGMRTTSLLSYCAGTSINDRCLGEGGEGFLVAGEGSALLMGELGAPAPDYANARARKAREGMTVAHGGDKALVLTMSAPSAKRVTDQICR